MKNPPPPSRFLLIALGGFCLAAFSAVTLKTQAEQLGRMQFMLWGFFMIAGCVFTARGLMAYNKHKQR